MHLYIPCTMHATYTHHFPDKQAGYNVGKLISKQTLMKAINLEACLMQHNLSLPKQMACQN